jgi:hypothetical protein
MTNEDAAIDALHAIASEIKETRQEIAHCLRNISSHLQDISSMVAEINKAMPNPLELPE